MEPRAFTHDQLQPRNVKDNIRHASMLIYVSLKPFINYGNQSNHLVCGNA